MQDWQALLCDLPSCIGASILSRDVRYEWYKSRFDAAG